MFCFFCISRYAKYWKWPLTLIDHFHCCKHSYRQNRENKKSRRCFRGTYSDYESLQCSCFEHLRRLQQVKLLDQEKRRCHKFIKHLICVMKMQKKSLISDHVLDFGSSEASSCFWSTWNKSGQRDKYNLLLLLFCFIFNKASLCVADRMRRRKKRKTHADDVLMNLLIRILCENKVTNKHKQGREIKLLWTSCYHLIMRI